MIQPNHRIAAGLLLMGMAVSGCTNNLDITAKNATSTPLVLSVLATKEGETSASKLLETEVLPGSSTGPLRVGEYKVGTMLSAKMALPHGGVTGRSSRELLSKPNPFPMMVEVHTIAAPSMELSDSASIERQITGVAGSYSTPTADIGAFVEQYLGGLFVKNQSGTDVTFTRKIDPSRLGSKVSEKSFMPQIGMTPEYQLTLTTDQANNGNLKAQLPDVVEFKTDFSQSTAYRYDFSMKNTAWRATPNAWYTIERKLSETPEGKKTLSDIKVMLAQYGELYYLDSAFVLGDVSMEVSSAEMLGVDVDVGVEDTMHAGAAFKWRKNSADTKRYNNLILRVRFEQLRPYIEQNPSPSMTKERTAELRAAWTRHGDGTENSMVYSLQKELGFRLDDVRIVPSPAPSTSPLYKIGYKRE
jgi:hypothetical protein